MDSVTIKLFLTSGRSFGIGAAEISNRSGIEAVRSQRHSGLWNYCHVLSEGSMLVSDCLELLRIRISRMKLCGER